MTSAKRKGRQPPPQKKDEPEAHPGPQFVSSKLRDPEWIDGDHSWVKRKTWWLPHVEEKPMMEGLAEHWMVLICIMIVSVFAIMSAADRRLTFTLKTSLKRLGINITAKMTSRDA
jgi:hypothetical protein